MPDEKWFKSDREFWYRFTQRFSPIKAMALSSLLATISVALCGTPFFFPVRLISVTVAISFVLMLYSLLLRGRNFWLRLLMAIIPLSFGGFSTYLVLHERHLIDWLEGH